MFTITAKLMSFLDKPPKLLEHWTLDLLGSWNYSFPLIMLEGPSLEIVIVLCSTPEKKGAKPSCDSIIIMKCMHNFLLCERMTKTNKYFGEPGNPFFPSLYINSSLLFLAPLPNKKSPITSKYLLSKKSRQQGQAQALIIVLYKLYIFS